MSAETVFAVMADCDGWSSCVAVYSTRETADAHAASGNYTVEEVAFNPSDDARLGAHGAQVDTLGGERAFWSDTAQRGSVYGPWELQEDWQLAPERFGLCGQFRVEVYESTPEQALERARSLLAAIAITPDIMARRKAAEARRLAHEANERRLDEEWDRNTPWRVHKRDADGNPTYSTRPGRNHGVEISISSRSTP